MPPQTGLNRFDEVLKRGRSMVESSIKLYHLSNSTSGKITVTEFNKQSFYSDMCRAGIVTVVAAFDSYFTFKFSEAVVPYLKKKGPTKKLLALLEDAGMDTEFALNLLSAERPYRKIRTLVESKHERYTTQKFHVIDELYESLGLKDFSNNVEKKAKRKSLKASINILISRRHAIAHSGDINRYGNLSSINPYEIEKRIKNVELFVKNADIIITNVIG